jgi:hypothetical protein
MQRSRPSRLATLARPAAAAILALPVAAILNRFRRHIAHPTRIDIAHQLHRLALLRWATANGYTRQDYPGMIDWHRLRTAGLDG